MTECPEDAHSVPLPPICGAPRLEPTGAETWLYTRVLECSMDGVVGSRDEHVLGHVTIDLPSDGMYELASFGDGSVIGALAPCGPCPWLRQAEGIYDSQSFVALIEGRYVLSLRGPGDETSLAGVMLRRVGPIEDPEEPDSAP